jgi:hypothetical protein
VSDGAEEWVAQIDGRISAKQISRTSTPPSHMRHLLKDWKKFSVLPVEDDVKRHEVWTKSKQFVHFFTGPVGGERIQMDMPDIIAEEIEGFYPHGVLDAFGYRGRTDADHSV